MNHSLKTRVNKNRWLERAPLIKTIRRHKSAGQMCTRGRHTANFKTSTSYKSIGAHFSGVFFVGFFPRSSTHRPCTIVTPFPCRTYVSTTPHLDTARHFNIFHPDKTRLFNYTVVHGIFDLHTKCLVKYFARKWKMFTQGEKL